ncbi:cation:proton antiporter domain-containing protein [Actinospongicola halichondriae]|uniref:cation:proton antiporter domain-containing protein n=1 Tax=Actinospongicola halichondriae TaxID=3236844 RepID=UPI003D41E33B
MNLEPPSEHHVLVFFAAILCLLVVARLLGSLMQRLGQPAVVGELGAGVLLGPSVLGRVSPEITDWLFPDDEVQTAMLFTVGWLGVVLLLVATGAETDLGLIRRLGRAAALVSITSLVAPLALGFAVGMAMPDALMADPDQRDIFALFIAAALAISSLPVMAKILGEMNLLRRDFGQLTLAAGMVNDVVGWILLGAVAGLASAGQLEIGALTTTIGGVAAFFLLSFTLGQRLLDAILREVRRRGNDASSATAGLLVVVVGLGVATQWLGVEAVLGAFVAGILVGRSKFADEELLHPLESLTTAFFAPIFFATAGLRVDLGLLADTTVALWTGVVVLVASVAKFGGSWIGARMARLSPRESTALSIGLNARGALEIVIATIGLSLGVLNEESYTAVVVMAIVTSVLAPPMLRIVLRDWQGTDQERARLEQEETLRTNRVVRDRRVLIPSEGSASSIMAAQIVDLVWPAGVEATVLTVTNDDEALRPVIASLGNRPVEVRAVSRDDIAESVVAEARLGYGAIAVGAPSLAPDHLLSPLVDELLADHDVPVLVVRRGRAIEGELPWAHARAVVPVTGTANARAAQEVAFNLSSHLGTEIVLTHVLEPEPALVAERVSGNGTISSDDHIADDLLDAAEAFGAQLDARTTRSIRRGNSVASEICDQVIETESDLVVVGASARRSNGIFLGHTIEQILERCDATVVVVLTPRPSA